MILNKTPSAEMQKRLIDSASHGCADRVAMWLESGADACFYSPEGLTPLMLSTRRNHYECVKLLLPFSNINATVRVPNLYAQTSTFKGATSLQIACMFGFVDIVRLFLSNGAEPDLTDSEGCTPLMTSLLFSHQQCFTELLRNGAATFIRNKNGKNIYDMAELMARRDFEIILNSFKEKQILNQMLEHVLPTSNSESDKNTRL